MQGDYYVFIATNDMKMCHPINFKLVRNFKQIAAFEHYSRVNHITCYEVLHNDNRKIYLDVDKIESREDMFKLVKDFIKFAKIPEDTEYIITENIHSPKGKLSYHVIFDLWTNVSNMRNLVEQFKYSGINRLSDRIDSTVYTFRQEFRLPYQSGIDQDNVHKIIFWNNSDYETIQEDIKRVHSIEEKREELWNKRETLSASLKTITDEVVKNKINDSIREITDTLTKLPIYNDYSSTTYSALEKIHKCSIIQYIENTPEYERKWIPVPFCNVFTIKLEGSYIPPEEQIPDLELSDDLISLLM